MKDGDSFVGRSRILKMDALSEDILRLMKAAPSEYTVAKRLLSDCRAHLMSDQKRACKLMMKALDLVKEESQVAAGYNSIRDRIPLSDDPSASKLDERYHVQIREGDFKGAKKTVSRLNALTSDLAHPLTITMHGDGFDIKVSNHSDRTIVIILLRGRCGGSDLVFDPASFAMAPFSERVVSMEGQSGNEVEITAEYRDGSTERTYTSVASLHRGAYHGR